jgi:heme/copper-type cytochrome/quinol oxidase subunit 2
VIAIAAPSPQPQPQPSPGRDPQQTSTGIVSLIFGVLQFVALPVVGTIIALVTGYSSRNEAARNSAVSDDLGRVGRILGWIGLVLTIGGVVLVLMFAALIGGLAFLGFAATPAL